MQLIVAEKPAVARDLARVLGLPARGEHALTGDQRTITWCVGHLVELAPPEAYEPRWKAWRLDTLPMVPGEFRLRPVEATRAHFDAVCKLLRDRRFTEVVNACDAGREGELIFRYLYQAAAARLPVRRLWISSLTDEAIRRGLGALKPGSACDALADAARCRSEADWLVGLNATRALTLRGRQGGGDSPLFSVGRVQTPTLAMLVEREQAIARFQPSDYHEVQGQLTTAAGGRLVARFRYEGRSRLAEAAAAAAIVRRCAQRGGARHPEGPVVETLERRTVREAPPLLFDLTSLQRTANRRFGLSAARTLTVAQALYEKHKLLTYPRTDSRHLPSDLVATLPGLFRSLGEHPDYQRFAEALLADPPRPSRRLVDDGKVRDHHAIIPTGRLPPGGALDRDAARLFDLVTRRFLGAFFPDAEFAGTRVVVRVGGEGVAPPPLPPEPPTAGDEEAPDQPLLLGTPPPPDRFFARGRIRLAAGWQEVAGFGDDERGDRDDDEGRKSLPPLELGERLGGEFTAERKQTRPPARYSDATILKAMEGAGRTIDDEALREAMKDSGLGTPATRAAILETLVARGYAERDGKQLRATALGIALVEAIPPGGLTSAQLTGEWEARLARIARGEERRGEFMAAIVRYVTATVAALAQAPPPRPPVAVARVTTGEPPKRRRAPGAKSSSPARSRAANPAPQRGRGAAKSRRGGKSRKTSIPMVAPAPATSAPGPAAAGIEDLICPRCGEGHLVTGRRGWGCGRWRQGCGFVVWFETAGRRLTADQVRELIETGRSRKLQFPTENGPAVSGRLVLEPERDRGAARLVLE